MLQFDVAIVGSGPAGERGATRAAYLGKKVCLIEKEAVPGGACANTGTIPSKALRETALAILQAKRRDVHGFLMRVADTVTVPALMGRRGLVTAREHTRIRSRLSMHGVETFRGTASFQDPHVRRVAPAAGDAPAAPSCYGGGPQPGLRLGLDPHARPGAAHAGGAGRRSGRVRVRLHLRRAGGARDGGGLARSPHALPGRGAFARAGADLVGVRHAREARHPGREDRA